MFIHGVSTRKENSDRTPGYSLKLQDKIKEALISDIVKPNFFELYWGEVVEDFQEDLKEQLQASLPTWDRVWMRTFREVQIMRFAGDAVAYISRHVGQKVVKSLQEQIQERLKPDSPEDCLHLVAHSWGSVILFDLFFAARWDDKNVPGYETVRAIRQQIFGLEPTPNNGVRLASIHTIGAPIAFFNMINIANDTGQESTHNITPELQAMLRRLKQQRGQSLPWINYIHPGDLIAYPLAKVAPSLAKNPTGEFLKIEDKIVREDWASIPYIPFSQTIIAVLHSGSAHQSYWNSKTVAQTIARQIQ